MVEARGCVHFSTALHEQWSFSLLSFIFSSSLCLILLSKTGSSWYSSVKNLDFKVTIKWLLSPLSLSLCKALLFFFFPGFYSLILLDPKAYFMEICVTPPPIEINKKLSFCIVKVSILFMLILIQLIGASLVRSVLIGSLDFQFFWSYWCYSFCFDD